MKRIAALLTLTVASAVQAASLIPVGVLDPANPYSEIRAVSSDGNYAVGCSYGTWVYTASSFTGNGPIIWSMFDGLVALPCPSGKPTMATGVAVGVGSNAGNIIASGLHEGDLLVHRYYKAPQSNLAGGAWADSASAGGWTLSSLRGGSWNDLRSSTNPADGRWYTGAIRDGAYGRAAFLRGDPFIGWDGTNVAAVHSISAYAVLVGRSMSNPSTAFFESSTTAFTSVPGSSGFRADGHGISSSFGKSATTDFDVQWICGQANNYNGPNTTMQAFRWKRGDASMTFLGSLAPAGGGDAGDNSSTAYAIADNGITVGRSFFGTAGGGTIPSYEVATIWGVDGLPQSLETMLTDAGVDISAWTHLVRIYAVSDDGKTLAGYGTWAADGSTRGFVAHLDDFIVKGACCVTTGLGTGSCSLVTSDECTALGGRYLGDGVQCGTNGANCGGFCAIPFADADVDGDVDQADFALLQACYTDIVAEPPVLSDACACLDRGLGASDDKIDADDWAEFEKCATGPGIPWVAGQLPLCVPGDGTLP